MYYVQLNQLGTTKATIVDPQAEKSLPGMNLANEEINKQSKQAQHDQQHKQPINVQQCKKAIIIIN